MIEDADVSAFASNPQRGERFKIDSLKNPHLWNAVIGPLPESAVLVEHLIELFDGRMVPVGRATRFKQLFQSF